MVVRSGWILRCLVASFVLGAVPAWSADDRCGRIVTLAPSITEVVFELGLGERVVGVSRYDRYPAAVRDLPRVGGLLDPNFEVVVGLRPSVVVALAEFGDKVAFARELGLAVVTVDHRSVQGILDSFETLGERCGVAQVAAAKVGELRGATARIAGKRSGAAPVRTMVVVGGGSEGSLLKSVYVSGTDGFYDDLIGLAGGENVVRGATANVPTLSAEGLLALDPEVIIQVRDEAESGGTSTADIEGAWRNLPGLRAVRTGRVYVLSDDYITIPGPRFVQTLERFAERIGAPGRGDVR